MAHSSMFPFIHLDSIGVPVNSNIVAAREPNFAVVQSAANDARGHFTDSKDDVEKNLLWLIDVQNGFVQPGFSLVVPGAVEDTKRTAAWMMRNMEKLTGIWYSLDTHYPFHIFSPSWWEDANGNPPVPLTVISNDDVRNHVWIPRFQQKWSREYVMKLETIGKKQLVIWPYHTMIGTPGHALVPEIYELTMFHTLARNATRQNRALVKGTASSSESYSVVEAEVPNPKDPETATKVEWLSALQDFDRIFIAGQARSHCVLETVKSVLKYFAGQPQVISKFNFLLDCTSTIPDFEAETDAAMQSFAAQGINFIDSTYDIP